MQVAFTLQRNGICSRIYQLLIMQCSFVTVSHKASLISRAYDVRRLQITATSPDGRSLGSLLLIISWIGLFSIVERQGFISLSRPELSLQWPFMISFPGIVATGIGLFAAYLQPKFFAKLCQCHSL